MDPEQGAKILRRDQLSHKVKIYQILGKRTTGPNGHLKIRDCTLTPCQKNSYLHINMSIIEEIKIIICSSKLR